MSTPPSKDASVVQSTQKQLDELDALIQKMLELPVAQLEEDPFAGLPARPLPTAAPARTLETTPRPETRKIEAEASAQPAEQKPAHAATEARAGADEPVVAATQEPARQDPPEPQVVDKPAPVVKQSTAETNKNRERLERQWSRAEEATPEPITLGHKVSLPRLPSEWYLLPLVLPNRAYDRFTVRCGRPGSWLRSRRGRNLVGWLGIGLIVAALGWALLDWIAWNW